MERRRREGRLPDPPLENFKLRVVPVEIRPSYKEEDRVFASATALRFPVHAVAGTSRWGPLCFLPLFEEHFYFHSQGQLPELTQHFVRERLYGQAPEQVHRFIAQGEISLDRIVVKDKEGRRGRRLARGDELHAPRLARVAVRLPRRSGRAEAAYERAEEVKRLRAVLRSEGGSILVVGEPGTGKSNLILAAIRQAVRPAPGEEDERPPAFWRTTPGRLTAQARYLGDWQQICEEIVRELQHENGTLYMLDFLNLFATGGEGPEDSVAAFLRPFLAEGRLRMIGEVTPAELEAARRILPDFTGHFQTLFLEELEDARVLALLGQVQQQAGRSRNVRLRDDAVDQAYLLLKRYVRYESFPGKAVNFLTKLVNDTLLAGGGEVTRADVIRSFIERTGLPETLLRDDLLLGESELQDFFGARIKGQPDTLRVLASVVKIFKVGLNNPDRPIAALLFAGPTGTGKTASARALAEYFFGEGAGQDPLIRVDMSEYQHPAQLERLIGSAGGRPGKLVERLRERPFAVVLLDEIEKAHPVFFDVLLSVLDQGRLTDAFGRVTDFRNTIIVMTSNLGADARASLGFGSESRADFAKSVRDFFRPEFFNRLDEVVVFRPLDEESLRAITRQELEALGRREGLRGRRLKLEYSARLVAALADRGYEPRYGARPLARLIEREIVSRLARLLLSHRDLCDATIELDFTDGEFHVTL